MICAACISCRNGKQPVSNGADGPVRYVTDSRGVRVAVPRDIRRVVTVSDGLVEGVMTRLGVQDKIVGIGSDALRKTWNYDFETAGGEKYSYKDGMNPVLMLNPGFRKLPVIAGDTGVNYEALAALDPDVVIIRLGSCNLWTDDEKAKLTVKTLDALGFPLVVLHGTHFHKKPNIGTITKEIKIVGQVFGQADRAAELADYIESQVDVVRKRTSKIAAKQRPSVLVFGASSAARDKGGAGQVFGRDTIESFFIEDVAHARNAYPEPGYFKVVSAEHLFTIDPDVIVLCTAAGYHPPRELYEAPYYRDLGELAAVKNRRVAALPWTPWNCAKRLEYPIDVMVIAKAAYPDLFEDIDLGDWLLDFYMNVYDVDRDTAIKLRSAQWMDWTKDG